MPRNKAILVPIIYKEDSFAEDKDLQKDPELLARAKDFADNVKYLGTTVDGKDLHDLYDYRVLSEFFDLVFPKNSVYDVSQVCTKAICDGYWIFLKPFKPGIHEIDFTGIALFCDQMISLLNKSKMIQCMLNFEITLRNTLRLKWMLFTN